MSSAPGNVQGLDKLAEHKAAFDQNQSGRAVSMGALSDMQHQTTAMELVSLQKWHAFILRLWFPLCFVIVVMSCLFADIAAKKDRYDDPNGSWQACMTQADYTYIPLNVTIQNIFDQVFKQKSALQSCIGGLYPNTCDFGCVVGIATTCATPTNVPHVNNIALPSGHFLDGFSYLGIQCIIFSAVANFILHKSLRHPSWLLSCCCLMSWFLLAIMTYYTVSPILPVPNNINSTFITYMVYASLQDKFDNFNKGHNHCGYSQSVMWLYLMLVMGVILCVFGGILIAIRAERIRYKSPNKPHYNHLQYTEAPVILSFFAACSYVVFIGSKMTSAVTELHGIQNYDDTIYQAAAKGQIWYEQIWFPFAVPTLDITTIVGIAAIMSVLRGFTVQSLSAFRVALGASAVYAVSIYPGLVAAYQFYDYNNFYSDHDCKHFFLDNKGSTSQFGYPNDDEAWAYCQAFRMSIVAVTCMSFCVHGIAIACVVTILNNEKAGRDSLVHEVYDFDSASAFHEVSSNRGSFAVPAPGQAGGAPKPLLSRASTKTGEVFTSSSPVKLESPIQPNSYATNPMGAGKV